MPLARSRLTQQGQISVPVSVRKKLGLVPGSVLEWDEKGDEVVVRRTGRYTMEDIHKALFGNRKPRRRSLKELKQGIEKHIRDRHARD